jgi:hypothetical protein
MDAVIFIIGSGPHGRELADLARDLHLDPVMLDDNREVPGTDGDIDALVWLGPGPYVLGPAWPRIRRQVDERVSGLGLPYDRPAVLVHPSAMVISPGARVLIGAHVGRHSHIHANAVVAHSSWVGEFSMVCPGAMIAGECHIGDDVFVGVGASIKNGVTVGDGALIGAGAVVVRDVDPGDIVVGSPAKPLV